jgi:uncharacterized membrane protein
MPGQIRRGDGLLVWLNLLSPLFVTFLPASAALLGRLPLTFVGIACFAADVVLIQLAALWLWRHAGGHGLVNAALDPRVRLPEGLSGVLRWAGAEADLRPGAQELRLPA